MPHKTWVHECKENGNKVWLGEEICRSCGEIGTPDGYGLTGIEAMGNFNRLTGLPTIGPHRKTLPEFTEICPACQGEGVVVIEQWDRWYLCRSCGGTGEIVTVPEKKFMEIQKAAWEVFDNWRLENADAAIRAVVFESQRNRQYKTIYTRDHYGPKRTKREIRYFAKMDRLFYEGFDDAVSDSELAPQVVKETKAPIPGVFFWILIILMLVKGGAILIELM